MLDKNIYINSIAVIAPGLGDIEKSEEIFKGNLEWSPVELSRMVPSALPANEARRTTTVIRLALKVVESVKKSSNTSVVFASSEGDLDITDKICKALATKEKMVSPTLFHNSVHNAPAGYLSISDNMKTPSISLSAGDNTFSAGLIESVAQVLVESNDVLLVAYDNVTPEDLDEFRHFDHPVAIALLLSKTKRVDTIGSISITVQDQLSEATPCFNHSLEVVRNGNPIGLGLPLVESLFKRKVNKILIPYLNQKRLLVKVNNV